MTLIDGKATAAQIKEEIKQEVEQMVLQGLRRPHLAAILVGHDGGSETYVKNKVLACEACGFESTLLRFEDDITEEFLLQQVEQLNNDPGVDGFIVQLPLPKHISEQKVIEAEAAANVKKTQAEAEAYEIQIKAEAEAEANKKLAESITQALIEYKYYETWNGELPEVVGSDATLIQMPQ